MGAPLGDFGLLKTTPDKPGYMVNQEPISAWKEYCRVLFSANEFEFLN